MKPDRKDLIDESVRRATEEGREKLGGPPSRDELQAYRRGELSPDERDLMEERLAHYPEAVRRLLAIPKPNHRAVSPEAISDEELEREWASLQARLAVGRSAPAPARVRVSKIWILGVAASLLVGAIGIGGAMLAWRDAASPRIGIGELRLVPEEPLRGPETDAILLDRAFQSYLLTLEPKRDQADDYPRHRLQIAPADAPARPLWSTDEISRNYDGTFRVFLPLAFLDSGTYQLQLYGLRGDDAAALGEYRVRVR